MRLFIAIPISEVVRKDLVTISEHRSHWPVSWVPYDNLHLTLIFLGNQNKKDLEKICESIKLCAQNADFFRIRLSYFEVFPSKKRLKLVWVKSRNNPDLERFFDNLYLNLKAKDPALVSFCKTYLPHVTLGRFKGCSHPAFTYTPSLPFNESIAFIADKISLFESKLGGQHSTYTEIFSAKLITS